MENIKELTVTVTYKVGLGNLTASEDVIKELEELYEKGSPVDPSGISGMKYPHAAEWLGNEIKERDCMDWEIEIDHLELNPSR